MSHGPYASVRPAIRLLLANVLVVVLLGGCTSQSDNAGSITETTDHDDRLDRVSVEDLVPFSTEPALIYHPELLPGGMELCQQTTAAPQRADFCAGAEGERVWVIVRPAEVMPTGGPAVAGLGLSAHWISRFDPLRLSVLYNQYSIEVGAEGVDESALVAIANSIPLVGDVGRFRPSPEALVELDSLSEEELAGLVEHIGIPVRVYPRQLIVQAAGFTLTAMAGSIDPVEVAFGLPSPRLIDLDSRPVLVAIGPTGRSTALWTQRGWMWQFDGSTVSEEGFVDLVRETIGRISKLG